MKRILLGFVGLLVVAIVGWATLRSPAAVQPPKVLPTPQKTTPTTVVFDKHQLSITDPSSLWVITNKKQPLVPADYSPSDLVYPKVALRVPGNESMQVRASTAHALEKMVLAADQAGVHLMLSSGYRSYNYQVGLYNGYVKSQGQALADTQSARPGHSEHQTGLAVDLEPTSRHCEVEDCFAATPEGQWLNVNAYRYGFLLRYTTAEQAITGYKGEPWHYRFVGTELSNQLHDVHVPTLEQFFSVSGGDYN